MTWWDLWTVGVAINVVVLVLQLLPGHLNCHLLHRLFGWHFVLYRKWPSIEQYKWTVARVRTDSMTGDRYINAGPRFHVRLREDGTAGGDTYIPITWALKTTRTAQELR